MILFSDRFIFQKKWKTRYTEEKNIVSAENCVCVEGGV